MDEIKTGSNTNMRISFRTVQFIEWAFFFAYWLDLYDNPENKYDTKLAARLQDLFQKIDHKYHGFMDGYNYSHIPVILALTRKLEAIFPTASFVFKITGAHWCTHYIKAYDMAIKEFRELALT